MDFLCLVVTGLYQIQSISHCVTDLSNGSFNFTLGISSSVVTRKAIMLGLNRASMVNVADMTLPIVTGDLILSCPLQVSELQTSLSKANVEKDIATRESTKALQECEFLKQQVGVYRVCLDRR